MWKEIIIAKTATAIRFRISQNEQLLSFKEVFELWSHYLEFRDFYIHLLTHNTFAAFYWEHPGLRTSLLHHPYELVLLISTRFERRTLNETAFADFFQTDDLVTNFDNLGKNARLVVPTPIGEVQSYKHLASFLRSDKAAQHHALFQQIGTLILQRIHPEKTIWLNTAGNGVIWLHVRLDSRPKYYKTQAYRNPDFLK